MQLKGKQLMLYSSGIVALLMFLMFRSPGIFSAIAFFWNCRVSKTTVDIHYAFVDRQL
jgi:hypothetical protein